MPKSKSKPITLSFDNGPHPDFTPRVLDVLAHHAVKATFFVVGNQFMQNRAPAERAREEGHWIGNHTWDHSYPFREKGNVEFVQEQIEDTQAALGDLAHPDKFFRPYGGAGRLDGALNRTAADHLMNGKYTCVLWNSVPGDFRDAEGWPETAMKQIAEIDWPLVVLHDIHGDAMARLDGFIGALKDEGYVFRQDFPETAVAIRKGRPTPVLKQGVVAD